MDLVIAQLNELKANQSAVFDGPPSLGGSEFPIRVARLYDAEGDASYWEADVLVGVPQSEGFEPLPFLHVRDLVAWLFDNVEVAA